MGVRTGGEPEDQNYSAPKTKKPKPPERLGVNAFGLMKAPEAGALPDRKSVV